MLKSDGNIVPITRVVARRCAFEHADEPRAARRDVAPQAEGRMNSPGEHLFPVTLREPLRIEMECGCRGSWICGLCEKASREAAELQVRPDARACLDVPQVGTRLRLLVVPRWSQPFSLFARVLSSDTPPDPSAPTRVHLVIDTADAAALTLWVSALEKVGGA